MIRNKLSDLLGERQMKISKLSLLTGIARSTLTPIYFNQSEMIKIETINKICIALNINVEEFFESVNFDIDFSLDHDEFENVTTHVISDKEGINDYDINVAALCEITEHDRKYIFDVKFRTTPETDLDDTVLYMPKGPKDNNPWHESPSRIFYEILFNSEEEKEGFYKYIDELSAGMKLVLENKVIKFLREYLIDKFKNDDNNQHFDEPKQELAKLFKKAHIDLKL